MASSSNMEINKNSPSKIRGGKGASKTNQQERIVHVFNTPEMKAHRRELRANGTPAERTLWNWLKSKQIRGLQFRRQFSVGHHILDFYCPALKLAIELDGDYHYHMAMPEQDWKRDQELLCKHGIKTLRFENKTVFEHPRIIINAILAELDKSTNCSSGRVNAPQPPLILEGELDKTAQHLKKDVLGINAPQPPLILEGELDKTAQHLKKDEPGVNIP